MHPYRRMLLAMGFMIATLAYAANGAAQTPPVAVSPNAPKFVAVPGVTIEDQFGPMTIAVKKPRFLSSHVERDADAQSLSGLAPNVPARRRQDDACRGPPLGAPEIDNPAGWDGNSAIRDEMQTMRSPDRD